jgi:hypothetical protein
MEDRENIQLSPLSPRHAKKSQFQTISGLKKATERLAVICPLIRFSPNVTDVLLVLVLHIREALASYLVTRDRLSSD